VVAVSLKKPFINKRALGSIAGIVGAGGNLGAVSAGFLFRIEWLSYSNALFILGFCVLGLSFLAFLVRFSPADESTAASEHREALVERAKTRRKPRFEPVPQARTGWRVTPMTVLRIYLGVALAIKGIYYITDMQQLEATLGENFGETRNLIAWFVVFAHSVGGACLALGFVTRLSAGLNAVVLAGATFIHFIGMESIGLIGGDPDFQFAMLVLVTLLVFLWQGSGRFSMDRMMRGDDGVSPQPERASG
jgi:uncharacterized membrane protein YphA (DoxX/SURF4 family)